MGKKFALSLNVHIIHNFLFQVPPPSEQIRRWWNLRDSNPNCL